MCQAKHYDSLSLVARHDEVNVIREALVAAEKSGLSKRTPADIMADVLANRSISGQL